YANFQELGMPALLGWNHERFAAYFSTPSSYPSVGADSLVALHNPNRMLRSASPAAVEVEKGVGRLYASLLGIPDEHEPQVYHSASESHLHATLVAISTKVPDFRSSGLLGKRLVMYTSELGHFFANKNAVAVGLGESAVRLIPTNEEGQMSMPALTEAIRKDKQNGLEPLMVIATVGTTSITSVDPVEVISGICRSEDVFLYVDAAYGGGFACLPERAYIRAGWDEADAICVNPHKTLSVPQGCSFLFIRDRERLRKICDHRGEYVPSANAEEDPMSYTLSCGLRFNTLASLFQMMTMGRSGCEQQLRAVAKLASITADLVAESRDFKLLRRPEFGVVCFRPTLLGDPLAEDTLVKAVCERIRKSGAFWIFPTDYQGRSWFRLAFGHPDTTPQLAAELISTIRQHYHELTMTHYLRS
ncbi:MAG: pyridoxal-dependent decarboxylase, partial [Verrucomicrobiales bacterium]|nr:pyridoxal-dependent decarboxylase [Verrucomicrobiales bacterium]